jgi:hypothetical protein
MQLNILHLCLDGLIFKITFFELLTFVHEFNHAL